MYTTHHKTLTKSRRKAKLCKCFLWKCKRLTVKEIGCFNIFYMILKAILCVQHFCSSGAINLRTKTDSTVICVPCILEHVCCEPFSLKIADLEDTLY